MATFTLRHYLTMGLLTLIALANISSADNIHEIDQTTDALEDNFIFDSNLEITFNDTYSSYSTIIQLDEVNLSRFNRFSLYFMVYTDQEPGENIYLIFTSSIFVVQFDVGSYYQDGTIYVLEQPICLETDHRGNLTLGLEATTQLEHGQNATITLLTNTKITPITVPVIDTEQQDLVLVPSTITLEGYLFGTKKAYVQTVFDAEDNNASVEFQLNFTVSAFTAITKQMSVFLNGNLITDYDFVPGANSFSFAANVSKQNNVLSLQFALGFSDDAITIHSFVLQGVIETSDNQHGTDDNVYKAIPWISSVDAYLDLTPFLPVSSSNEHILDITLVYSCQGSRLYPGITLELWQGTEMLTTESIPSSQQSEEARMFEIHTYTFRYNKDLTLHLTGTGLGSGSIIIWSNTSITIRDIRYFSGKPIDNVYTGANELYADDSIVELEFYDVIYSELDGTFNMSVFLVLTDAHFADTSSSLSVSISVNNHLQGTTLASDNMNIEFNQQIDLIPSYNEISISIKLTGKGSYIKIASFSYVLNTASVGQNPENEGVDQANNLFNVPFFKTPRTIAAGLFVLFDMWLLLGIFLRLYRSRKLRKAKQSETDEFILEIAQLSDMN